MKKWLYSTCSFLSPVTRLALPIFDHSHPNLWSGFNFCDHASTCKKSVPSVLSWDTDNFRVQRQNWPTSFLTIPHQNLFTRLLNLGSLYQHSKNEAISTICSWKMLDLKIPRSEWLRAFWPISQEQYFFQIEDLYRNTANNINFHYRANSGKINDQIFLQIQKNLFLSYFWPISPSFLGKNVFPKNLACITW